MPKVNVDNPSTTPVHTPLSTCCEWRVLGLMQILRKETSDVGLLEVREGLSLIAVNSMSPGSRLRCPKLQFCGRLGHLNLSISRHSRGRLEARLEDVGQAQCQGSRKELPASAPGCTALKRQRLEGLAEAQGGNNAAANCDLHGTCLR